MRGLRAEQMEALGEQFGDGAGEELGIVGAGEGVQVGEREAAPGSAENTEPGDAVEGIEEGAGEGERVEDFGAGGELFKIDGAEGNFGFAQGLGDGGEGVAGAAEDGDAVVSGRLRAPASMRSMWLRIRATISLDLGVALCADCSFRRRIRG